MPSVEDRVKALENQLGLGFGGVSSENMQDLINQHASQIAQLNSQLNTGNVLGGMVRTQIAPAAFPIGPYRQDVDATFGMEFTLWIPDYALRIKRALIVLTPKKTRTATIIAAATGSFTGVPSSDHQHRWALYRSDEAGSPGWAQRIFDSYLAAIPEPAATEGVEFWAENAADLFTSKPGPGTSSVASSTHTHPLTLSISESGMAAGMHLYIDGVDRTTALGGPWSAEATLDITDYLVDVRLRPEVGAHPIKVTSTAAGAIEAVGDIYGIIKAVQS